MTTSHVHPPTGDGNVVDFPTSSEDQVRRQVAEAERLANFSLAEVLLWAPASAERLGMPVERLIAAVKAIQAKKEQAKREAKADLRRTEKRREARDRTDAKRAETEARRQEKEAEREKKEEAKKQKAIAVELKAIAKLPCAEQDKRLIELAGEFDTDVDELRAELEVLIGRRDESEIELWPEPVETKDLLRDVTAQVRKYAIVSDDGAMATGLWCLFAWVHEKSVHSPILLVTSAEKESGKSTLLGVLSFLTPRPYATVELTGAGVYRVVDLLHPTLIVDEADKLFKRKNDLLHICNSGWTRGTKVTRIVGGVFPREFDTFTAKVIGMKGLDVPDTLSSRGIVIKMWPKMESEEVEDFQYHDDETFETLRRKAARWARDFGDKVAAAQPAMPLGFSNRLAANWKPLLAVAELAGCLEQAHRAAVALVQKRRGQVSEGLRLLAAIREVLGTKTVITSSELVKKLVANGDGEWCEFRNQGPISKRQIALLLDQYDIHPVPLHVGKHSTTERGYRAEWFADVFARYLSPKRATVSRGKRK
jgi:uncharacterized protein DUF3631